MEIMTIRSSGGGRDSGGGGVLGLPLITDMLSQKKAKYNEVEIRIEDKQRVEAKGEAMGKQAKRASGSDGDGDSDGGVSELPHDLIVEVLRRLPTKSLMRCQCVSKLWCSTIRHPDFLKARSRFRFRRFRIEIPSNTFLLDYQPPGIARSFLP